MEHNFRSSKMVWSASLMSLMMASGCASATRLSVSREVPAADGTIKTEVTDNGNTKLKLNVKHLAKPQNIAAQAKTFVVWAASLTGGTPQNLGALKVDENLNGSIETATPLYDFELFITAEPSPWVEAPSGAKLFWIDVMRRA